ncbi:MAG: redoxin domain-containing protein [Alphaproteobacteria bacterium]
MAIQTGAALPPLSLPLVGGGTFTLNAPPPVSYTLLVFYRGLHCRRCPAHLASFQAALGDFVALGATVVAVSSDDAARAAESAKAWGIDRLPIAYGFPVADAAAWGLYVSEAAKPGDPARFTEPAFFCVDHKGRLDSAAINTGPRLRVSAAEALAHVQDRLKGGE